jgi:Amidase
MGARGRRGDSCSYAVGMDQGGSTRVPAALYGIIRLKPTHGFVPYPGFRGKDAINGEQLIGSLITVS